MRMSSLFTQSLVSPYERVALPFSNSHNFKSYISRYFKIEIRQGEWWPCRCGRNKSPPELSPPCVSFVWWSIGSHLYTRNTEHHAILRASQWRGGLIFQGGLTCMFLSHRRHDHMARLQIQPSHFMNLNLNSDQLLCNTKFAPNKKNIYIYRHLPPRPIILYRRFRTF